MSDTAPVTGIDDVFSPPGESWRRVSPKLVTARRLVLAVFAVPLLAIVVWFAVDDRFPSWLFPVAAGLWLVGVASSWWVIGRRVRSWGYAETADELQVSSGILVRRLVVVPYGRLQLVEVSAGPIDRSLGIASVQLHTAAATSDATIPGLVPSEAAALRDRLAARGEQRSAGL
jgi:membrane protein YdbS with pleckstrin-like domain